MKKSLKILAVAMLCVIMLLALTGCGNKIKAVKEEDEGKETLVITLKGDKVTKAEATMEYEDKEEAAASYALIKAFSSEEEEMKVKLKGKKVIMTITGEYAEEQYEDMTKDEIIEQLEDEGYEVK